MARPWLKVEPAVLKHPKTRRLALVWGCHPYTVVGFLVALWGYCQEFESDGDLAALGDVLDDLAAPCLQRALQAPTTVLEALQEVGFADADGHLHDWDEYSGALVDRRQRDRERQAARRKLESQGAFSRDEWLELLTLVGRRCAYCGRVRTRLGMDHVVPISRGGRHGAGNILPCCKRCNTSKGARTPAEAGLVICTEVLAAVDHTRFALPNQNDRTSTGRPISSNIVQSQSRVEQSRVEQRSSAAALGADAVLLHESLPVGYHGALDGHLRAARHPSAVAASIRALGPGGIHERYDWETIGRALFELAADRDPTFNARRLEAFCRTLGAAPPATAGSDPRTDAERTREILARVEREQVTP